MKKFLTILILLLLVAGGVLCGAWLLRSARGQAKLEQWLQKKLPENVRIEGLSGPLPLNGHLNRVELRDPSGVWLTAKGVTWSASLRSLIAGAPIARVVSAATVDVHHWPEFEEEGGKTTIPRFWIQNIEVGRVELPVELDGTPLPFRLIGAFRVETNGWIAAASAAVTWQGQEALVIGSARETETGTTFELRRASSDGLDVVGSGTLKPTRTMQLSATFTNAPLLTRLFGLEQLGNGNAHGSLEWADEVQAKFTFTVRDAEAYGISLASGSGEGLLRGDVLSVQVSEANGMWREGKWQVRAPLVVTRTPDAIEWAVPAMEWAHLAFTSTGRLSATEIAATFDAPSLTLTDTLISNRVISGRARVAARVAGSRTNPTWEFEVEGNDVRPRLETDFRLHPAQFHISGVASSDLLRVNATWAGWTESPFTLDAELPIRLSLDGRPMGPDPDGTVSAHLQFAVNLNEAGAYADLRGATVEGNLHGNVQVAGTWSKPELRGKIEMLDGRAEYPESGVVLNNIRVVIEGDQDQLLIREAAAEDGEGGRLSLDGAFRFESGKGFPLEAKLTLNRAALWRQPDKRTRFDGTVSVSGPLSGLSVTGNIALVDAEILLRPSPPSIPTLPLAQKQEEAPTVVSTSSWLKTVSLNLALHGREIHVSGRGLESTWQTDLKMSGRADAPRIVGDVSVERGYFLFMGRRFLLDRAALLFDGQWPPIPLLDIIASSRVGEMRAWLYANGPIDAPALSLESDPAYPPDEILSRLLFSRSTDSISPLQAVRLAHGLNVLRGRGSTIDVLERGQSALRIDQLELVQSDADEGISAISVGKYVGSNIYVAGEKGLGGAADLITIEVDLTPSLVLTTESSPRIREGIGLKWRHDY
ncbi:MAG: translocation/assembly module TamB domain-containing protein [Kiritimatiellae bacterium]|nr:translocation/assembly module TamB domain-containing protein [Kiritimatiellia bacterium]